jgi:bifunctional non-homologous end joining protein LigD
MMDAMAAVSRDTHNQTVTIDGRAIKLTNLDKVLFPETGTTKADVIGYYAAVADVMLPHLFERPVTRKRWPNGVGDADRKPLVFFTKDLDSGTPDWVERRKIKHRDHDNFYPVANDLATLTWLAQLAALEIHVPQWRFGRNGQPKHPDRLVLDLDPGEGVSLTDCAEVARWAREILSDIGHEPIPVTSGSKGIHLYAPLDGSSSYEAASAVARELARALEADHRDTVTAVMKKSERAGKVFIDWSQNNGSKTTVSPYSMRGRIRPTVAAPRTWAELDDPELRHLEYHELLPRITDLGDPMAALGIPGATPVHRSDRLATYRSMRDASKTPEPVPDEPPGAREEGFTFVIQEHHARALHYDFRLERDGVLVSWAVPKGPPTDGSKNNLAVQTEDHPLEYASFEGGIPRGEYGGGMVKIWDAGTYELHKWRDGKEVIVTLIGRPDGGLGGEPRKYALIHTGGGSNSRPERNWLIHLMQPSASPTEEPSASPTKEQGERKRSRSAGSVEPSPPSSGRFDGRTSSETSDISWPDEIAPMLATLAKPEEIPDQDAYAFEMKWDGVRTVAYLAGGRVKLLSRRGRDDTAAYFDVAEALADLKIGTAVLDGEVVVTDEAGRPRFGLLQHRINLTRPTDIKRAAADQPAQLMLFDILHLDGRSLIKEPYEERRRLLEDLIDTRPGGRIQVPPIFDGDLQAAIETSKALQLEGVVAKRRTSIYQPGQRSRTWLKIKLHTEQEVVIGGWRPGQGRRDGGVGSLLMGIPGDDGLHYVGRVGSGFNDRQLDEIERLLKPLARKTSPFTDVPREDARDAHWVTPSLVGEVTYGELTGPGRLRHPVWKGLRPDKKADGVVWETPSG